MISSVDTVLDHLLKSRVKCLQFGTSSTVEDEQVGFQPPDDDWHTQVANLGDRTALNVYLLDLRENRKLRSNERIRSVDNSTDEPAPARVDCHYLITAWSPAVKDEDKVAAEHPLIGETMVVLLNNRPLIPRRIFAPNPLPSGFPPMLADAQLPCQVMPPEGFPKLAEFWGTMGSNHRWKPAIYLVVTVPVALESGIVGPLVTTRITEYRLRDQPESGEVFIQIAGTVRNRQGEPIGGAWVRLEMTTGDPLSEPIYTAGTRGEIGRFTFSGLEPGQYRIHVVAEGYADEQHRIDVPSPDGGYDVTLS